MFVKGAKPETGGCLLRPKLRAPQCKEKEKRGLRDTHSQPGLKPMSSAFTSHPVTPEFNELTTSSRNLQQR